jgi:hypothetical protein
MEKLRQRKRNRMEKEGHKKRHRDGEKERQNEEKKGPRKIHNDAAKNG